MRTTSVLLSLLFIIYATTNIINTTAILVVQSTILYRFNKPKSTWALNIVTNNTIIIWTKEYSYSYKKVKNPIPTCIRTPTGMEKRSLQSD